VTATATDAVARWDDLLRAFAEVVEQQRSFLLTIDLDSPLDETALIVPQLELPDDMPPMPAEFGSWASSLLRDTAGLTELATQVLAAHPAPPTRRPRAFIEAASGGSMDQKL
jgi:hypothetical protein